MKNSAKDIDFPGTFEKCSNSYKKIWKIF